MMELVARDGSRRFWAYHNVLDTEAQPPYVLGHAQDITTQHIQEQQLHDLATRDPLTRAFNRRYLTDLAQQQFEGGAVWCLTWTISKKSTTPRAMPRGTRCWWTSWLSLRPAARRGSGGSAQGRRVLGVRSRCDIGTIERAGGHLPRARRRGTNSLFRRLRHWPALGIGGRYHQPRGHQAL